MDWLKLRRDALLDNGFFALLVLGIGAVFASLIAFGGRRADLPVWVAVLFGVVLLACVISNVVLFRRVRRVESAADAPAPVVVSESSPPPPPHAHAALLRRIDALDAAASKPMHDYPAEWPTAAAFNGILRDAREATGNPLLQEIEELRRGSSDGFDGLAHSATYGTVTTLLAQIRAIVE